jgi:hypothetical protein
MSLVLLPLLVEHRSFSEVHEGNMYGFNPNVFDGKFPGFL